MPTPHGKSQVVLALGEWPRRTRAVALRNLREAERLYLAEARNLVGTPGPTPSHPGQPPHRQSGRLQRGIVSDLDEAKLTLTFRSTAPYSAALERGTRHMAARPFMGPTWQRLRPRIAAIMARRK